MFPQTNPIIYSDPPHEEPYPQDNEIDSNGITFRSVYQWITGPYGEVCSILNYNYNRYNKQIYIYILFLF